MLKEGDLAVIYKDWQNEKTPLGVARLIKLKKLGYPFILEEMRENKQEVFIGQYWEIEWYAKDPDNGPYINPERKTYPIRVIEAVGYIPGTNEPDNKESDLLIDKFLTVDGREIY